MSVVMKLIFYFLFCLLLFNTSFPFGEGGKEEIKKLSKLEILESIKNQSVDDKLEIRSPDGPWFDLSSRYTKSILLSAVIPGSGQTYLGNELKGVGFTVAFFGTGLAALLNHSNFVGREDRLKVLVDTYLQAGDFSTADRTWKEIVFEKGNRENDYNRRNLFAYLTIGVWVLNMVDVILYSDDKGENEFASSQSPKFELGLSSQGQYNGIAIKFNLP